MDKFWKKVTSEDVSAEHRDKVLQMAQEHLRNRKVPALWRWSFSLGMALAAMVGLWFYTQQMNLVETPPEFAMVEEEFMDTDIEVISELDLYEDLEVLDQWSAI